MKRILMLLFVVAVALSCVACERENAEVLATVAEEAQKEELLEEEPEDDFAPAESEQSVTGTIVASDGIYMMICSDDNRNLFFMVGHAEVDIKTKHRLFSGSKVDIYYTGEIKGKNTANTRVTKMEQSLEQAEIKPGTGVEGGIIVSADESTLKVKSFTSKNLEFSIVDENIDMEHTHGLTEGDYVTVFYEGEFDGFNGSSVKVVKVVQ